VIKSQNIGVVAGIFFEAIAACSPHGAVSLSRPAVMEVGR